MGQAKRRGTFEQRLDEAQRRNASVVAQLLPNLHPSWKSYHEKHGAQKLSLKLIQAGLLERKERC